MEQLKQTSSGVNRKARTSAAMLGLALSMGASSLLLPRQDDKARASEPVPVDADTFSTTAADASEKQLAGESDSDLSTRSGLLPEYAEQASPSAARSLSTVESPEQQSSRAADSLTGIGDRQEALSRLRIQRERLSTALAEFGVEESASPSRVSTPTAVAQPAQVNAGDRSAAQRLDRSQLVTYWVKAGDTLHSIAKQHGTSQVLLADLNQLEDIHELRVNQVLMVPKPSAVQPSTLSGNTQPSQESAQFLNLDKASETALVNASGNNVESAESSEAKVARAPSLEPSISDQIRPDSTLQNGLEFEHQHRVVRGDTIAQLSRRYGVSMQDLAQANGLSNPNLIRVGQVLTVPGQAADSARQPAPTVQQRESTVRSIASTDMAAVLGSSYSDAVSAPEVLAQPSEQTNVRPERDAPAVGKVASASIAIGGSLNNSYTRQFVSDFEGLTGAQAVERSEVNSGSQQPVLVSASPLSFVPTLPDVDASFSIPARTVDEPQQATPSESLLEEDAAVELSPAFQESQAESPEPVSQQRQTDAAIPESSEEVASDDGIDSVTEPQLLAAAPVGSESYEPLLEPLVGRLVSPELPPLPGADAFLPEGTPVFNGYIWPSRGVLTSGYGRRWGRMHRGIDIGAPTGTPVYAAASGVIEFSGWNSGGYGYMVDIRHPDGSKTRYAHNSRLMVRAGQQVTQGEQIAAVGSTGYSTGPHLHFEIHLPSQGTVNPMSMLPGR
jgi:murein DD-endopeptidase MepM/ murein hydrolase activator NlpD